MAFAAPIAGAVGGLGGFGSAISAIGSVLGALSSFMPKDTPDVQSPPPVYIPPSDPLPTQATQSPNGNLTESQKRDVQDSERRRRLLSSQSTADNKTIFAGENPGPANVKKTTLLGG